MEEDGIPASFYDSDYYSNMAGGGYRFFLETKEQGITTERLYYIELAQLEPGMKILDLGCGRAEIPIYCALQKSVDAWGIDYSETAIELANKGKEIIDPSVKERTHLICDDATNLDRFDDCTFDRIFSLSVIEHLMDHQIQNQFSGACRILKDDGIFIVGTHLNLIYLKYDYLFTRLFKKVMGRDVPKDSIEEAKKGGDINPPSRATIERSFVEAGFVCKAWYKPRGGSESIPNSVYRIGRILEAIPLVRDVFATMIVAVGAKDRTVLRRFCSS